MYTLHPNHVDLDGMVIPFDPENTDFARYLDWVAEGNTAAEPPAVAVVPPCSVTMRQARLALLEAGKLAAVNAAIAAMPSPAKEAAQIEWEFAATVERDSPFLQDLAGAIGLDDPHLNQLFALAASK